MATSGPSGTEHHERRTAAVLTGTVAGLVAILFPIITLVVVYLVIAGLTTRTESADRSLSLAGYLGFALAAVVICGLGGVGGNALSSFPSAGCVGIAVGWLLFGVVMLLLLGFDLLPSKPPWYSWGSFLSFIGLLGTPLVFAAAMATFTVGVVVRDARRRWLAVALLSSMPGLMIALYGCLDPLS
ncbi:hypothetical protein [Curtobacterium sp. MCBA15_001]|uniref:hypothetical protein n=1 Tax=Curtobacterium sp. MCBA15_001 TaxID=1898731 RepID=UPI0008DEA72D|nr:hypothetical protein [Curtobacterium sp. MCBA15_001]OIH97039.1 hypothetical protein BIU90_16320 [Curtobacterium sp. MCBA15_001]